MSNNVPNLPELLSARLEQVKTFRKVQDGRKMKREKWKNAYAKIIFEHYEQIDALITSGDTAMSLVDYLQELGVFTCGDYRLFDRAFAREKRRREKSQDRKIQSPHFNSAVKNSNDGDTGEEENSIKPRKDRKEF